MRTMWRRYPLLMTVLAVAAFLALIPFEDGPRELANGIVVAEVIFFLALTATLVFQRGTLAPSQTHSVRWSDWCVPLVCLLLWLLSWLGPMANSPLALDDLLYLYAESSQPAADILTPFNEHVVVLPRVWARVVRSTGELMGSVQVATVLARAVLFACVVFCAHRFFLRATGSRLAAVAAVAFFSQFPALTEVYLWFAASLWLWPLLLLIVGLDAVERLAKREQPNAFAAARVFLASGFGPLTFWIGVLNGPACALAAIVRASRQAPRLRKALFVACGLGGTATGIAVALAVLSWRKSVTGATPDLGNLLVWRRAILFGARFLTDHVLLGGWWSAIRDSFPYAYPLAFAAVAGGIFLMAQTMAAPRAAIAPLTLALASYALVFLSRADIPYQTGLRVSDRYHLYAHFCLGWLVAHWLASRRWASALEAKSRTFKTVLGIAIVLAAWVLFRPGAPGQTLAVLVELVR